MLHCLVPILSILQKSCHPVILSKSPPVFLRALRASVVKNASKRDQVPLGPYPPHPICYAYRMDKQTQDRLNALLRNMLKDERISKDEEHTLRDIIDHLKGDREALAFLRNRVFDRATEHIENAPAHTLRWLQRIDKLIDNATRPSPSAKHNQPICAFSPGVECLALIKQQLTHAKKTLDLCIFTITDDRISDEIIEAHKRGVNVRVISDNDKQHDTGSDIARLVKAKVPTRFDPDDDHMHHKFAIVDGTHLITGSYNWTRGATYNHENVLIFAHDATLRQYAAEFDRLWRAFG